MRQGRLHSTSWYTEFTIVPSPSLLETDSREGNWSEGGRVEEGRTEGVGLGSFLITPVFTKQTQKESHDHSACLLWVTASIQGPYENPTTADHQILNFEDKQHSALTLSGHWSLGHHVKLMYFSMSLFEWA